MAKLISKIKAIFSGKEKTIEEVLALGEFKKSFPNEKVHWTVIVEKKDNGNIIVGVAYAMAKPPLYKFYAVNKKHEAELLEKYEAPEGFWSGFSP